MKHKWLVIALLPLIWMVVSGFSYTSRISIDGRDPFHPVFTIRNAMLNSTLSPGGGNVHPFRLQVLGPDDRVIWQLEADRQKWNYPLEAAFLYGEKTSDTVETIKPRPLVPNVVYSVRDDVGSAFQQFIIRKNKGGYRLDWLRNRFDVERENALAAGTLARSFTFRQDRNDNGEWGAPYIKEHENFKDGMYREVEWRLWFYPTILKPMQIREDHEYYPLLLKACGTNHPGLGADSPVYIRAMTTEGLDWTPVEGEDLEKCEPVHRKVLVECWAISRNADICGCGGK